MMWSATIAVYLLLQPPAAKAEPKSEGPPPFEVQTTDQSSFRVAILDSTFEIATAYGPLVVPVKEIRKIEIGQRLTSDERKSLETALLKLTGPDRKARIAGREAVVALGEKALPALRRTKKIATDPEAIAGLADLETKIAAALKERNRPEKSDRDTVVTEGSTFTGTIAATSVRVLTGPFGEQKLNLADLVSARSLLAVEGVEEEGELVAFPANGLMMYQGQFGKVLRMQITGTIQGAIYGTNTYTLDSYLPTAAVHAGTLKLGETGIVKIRLIQGLNAYAGSSQNGIQSHAYGVYQPGAYEILGKAAVGGGAGNMGLMPGVPRGVILQNRIAPQAIIR